MPISHKYKTIFVHIPKTAGTSIEKVLGIGGVNPSILRSHKVSSVDGIRCAPQHLTCKMLRNNNISNPHWNTYFKFSFVRNPYDRVLSEFFWVKGKTDKKLKFDSGEFTNFLKTYYSLLDTDHKLSQHDFLVYDNKIDVDFVGKFENLNKDFEKIKRKLNLNANLPLVHKSSNKKEYLNLLTATQKNRIYNLYEKDFDFFGYKK